MSIGTSIGISNAFRELSSAGFVSRADHTGDLQEAVKARTGVYLKACDDFVKENFSEICDVDYFKTLCKKYPFASFGVEDRSLEATDPDWLPKRFSGNSSLQNFSNPGTFSVSFDVKLFEKAANDPEFAEKFNKFMEYYVVLKLTSIEQYRRGQ